MSQMQKAGADCLRGRLVVMGPGFFFPPHAYDGRLVPVPIRGSMKSREYGTCEGDGHASTSRATSNTRCGCWLLALMDSRALHRLSRSGPQQNSLRTVPPNNSNKHKPQSQGGGRTNRRPTPGFCNINTPNTLQQQHKQQQQQPPPAATPSRPSPSLPIPPSANASASASRSPRCRDRHLPRPRSGRWGVWTHRKTSGDRAWRGGSDGTSVGLPRGREFVGGVEWAWIRIGSGVWSGEI